MQNKSDAVRHNVGERSCSVDHRLLVDNAKHHPNQPVGLSHKEEARQIIFTTRKRSSGQGNFCTGFCLSTGQLGGGGLWSHVPSEESLTDRDPPP